MDKVRTVSDTKRDFYNYHTRPINSVYRRVVEELMVEMHLLSVNVDFRLDPVFSLGVVTSFERFMAGYRPEKDKESIFQALCKSVGGDAEEYRKQGEILINYAQNFSSEELVTCLNSPIPVGQTGSFIDSISAITNNPHFKYSRLFAIGLYALLQEKNGEALKEKSQRESLLKEVARALELPEEKLQKDLELYSNNLEKMAQVLIALEDTLNADRKQRDKRTGEAS